jgi:hypothetical protein
MTTGARRLVALMFAVGLEASSHAAGIKETAKLTVSGAGLPQSIEISEPSVLALSRVYAGTFIGAAATAPDAAWPRYAVAFDIQTSDGVKEAAYVVTYSKSRWTGEGYVYLPGPGDDWYRRNIGTILRDGQDGKWHHASPAWCEAINARLP